MKKRLEKRVLEELNAKTSCKAQVENAAHKFGSGSCTEDSESVSGGDDDDNDDEVVVVEKEVEKEIETAIEVAVVDRVIRPVEGPEPSTESTPNEEHSLSLGAQNRIKSLPMTEKNRIFESQSAPSSRCGSVSRIVRGSNSSSSSSSSSAGVSRSGSVSGSGSCNNNSNSSSISSSSSNSSSINRSTNSAGMNSRVSAEAPIVRTQGPGSARLRPVAPSAVTAQSSSNSTTSRQSSAVGCATRMRGGDLSALPAKLCGVSVHAVAGSRKGADLLPVEALVASRECHSALVESCVLGGEGSEGQGAELEGIEGVGVEDEEEEEGEGAVICDTSGALDEDPAGDIEGEFVGWGHGVDSLSLSKSMGDSEMETEMETEVGAEIETVAVAGTENCSSSTKPTAAAVVSTATATATTSRPCSVSAATSSTRPQLQDLSLQSSKVVLEGFSVLEDLGSDSLKKLRVMNTADSARDGIRGSGEERYGSVTEGIEQCSVGRVVESLTPSSTVISRAYTMNYSVHDVMNTISAGPKSDITHVADMVTRSGRKGQAYLECSQSGTADMQDVLKEVVVTFNEVESLEECEQLRILHEEAITDCEYDTHAKGDKTSSSLSDEGSNFVYCTEKFLSLSVADSRKSSQDTVNSSATTVSCTSTLSSLDRLPINPVESGLKNPPPLYNQMLSCHPSFMPMTTHSRTPHMTDASDQPFVNPSAFPPVSTTQTATTALSPLPITVTPAPSLRQSAVGLVTCNSQRKGEVFTSVTVTTAAQQVDPIVNHMPSKHAIGAENRKYDSDIPPVKNTDSETVIVNPPRVLAPRPRALLSDYYSHIGMIFPVAYSALGHRWVVCVCMCKCVCVCVCCRYSER